MALVREFGFAVRKINLYLKPMVLCSRPFNTSQVQANVVVSKLAKASAAAGGARPGIEVEKDPEKLCTYCCGANIYKTGEDPVIGPDSDYPDWLWDLHIDRKPVPLSEIPKDSFRYWRRVRKFQLRRENRMKQMAFK